MLRYQQQASDCPSQVKMQRIWTHNNTGQIKVYKLPRETLHGQVISFLCECLRGSPLVQVFLKLEICVLFLYQRQLRLLAKSADAQSNLQTILDTHALRVHAETEGLKHSFYTAFDFYGVSPSHAAGLYVVRMYNLIASSAARAKKVFVDSAQRQNVTFEPSSSSDK